MPKKTPMDAWLGTLLEGTARELASKLAEAPARVLDMEVTTSSHYLPIPFPDVSARVPFGR